MEQAATIAQQQIMQDEHARFVQQLEQQRQRDLERVRIIRTVIMAVQKSER